MTRRGSLEDASLRQDEYKRDSATVMQRQIFVNDEAEVQVGVERSKNVYESSESRGKGSEVWWC